MTEPLTADQRRAAEVYARTRSQAEAGRAIGTSATSIRRLLKRPDFAALVEEFTGADAPATPPAPAGDHDDDTEEEAVLRRVMRLTNAKGDPTVAAMKAAVALANLKAARANENAATHTVERVALTAVPDIDARVAAILEEAEPNESVFIMVAARDCGPNASGARIIGIGEGPWRPYEPVPHAEPGVTDR